MLAIILFEGEATGFACAPGETVLAAMQRAGARPVPVGCRGGGCGVCRVQVIDGDYRAGPMSRAHVSLADRARGLLACRVYPLSNLTLRPARRQTVQP